MGLIMHPGRVLSALAAVGLFVLGGCSGAGAGSGVASLSAKSTGTTAAKAAKKPSQQQTEDAFRKFAQCMREHGINMADPKGGKGGTVVFGKDGAPGDTGKVDAAHKACQHFIDSVVQGKPRDLDPAEEAKARDGALRFARCMREHGINMPDPEFQAGGRITQKQFGNPNDPKFDQAQTACAKEMPKGKGKGGQGPQFHRAPGGGAGSDSGASVQIGGE
jgi:hypothetical protein